MVGANLEDVLLFEIDATVRLRTPPQRCAEPYLRAGHLRDDVLRVLLDPRKAGPCRVDLVCPPLPVEPVIEASETHVRPVEPDVLDAIETQAVDCRGDPE